LTLFLHIATTLLFAALPCNVRSLDGTVSKGELLSIDKQNVVIQSEDGKTTLPLDQIQQITSIAEAKQRPEGSILLRLVNDSRLVAKDVTLASGVVSMTPWAGSRPQKCTRKQIRTLRFGLPSPSLDEQWNEVTQSEHAGDTLIIRKGTDSLDYLEGVVIAMDESMVTFEYDGDEIPVKRSKLEGILFYQTGGAGTSEEQPEPALVASLRSGGQLRANTLTVSGDQVNVTMMSGAEWSVPLEELSSVDFAVGRTLFLSDAAPAELIVTPHIASKLDEALTQLIYQPRNNKGQNNRPLQLRYPSRDNAVETYSKGLCLHSRTHISYRLGNAYQQLNALAGIDPQLGERGAVNLVIKADDETLLDEVVRGGEEPLTINLDVSKRRRVTIIVDYAADLDIADRLHLCDLRVTK